MEGVESNPNDKALSPRDRRDLEPVPDILTASVLASENRAGSEPAQDVQTILRHLWLRRRPIALVVVAAAAVTYAVVSTFPPLYAGSARVLVGVQAPRLPNVESVIADIRADAEQVQNESLIIQSRPVAGRVIDELHLERNADFNPALAAPSFWARFSLANVEAAAPSWLTGWIDDLRGKAAPEAPPTEGQIRERLIGQLLERLDVAAVGRSHVVAITAQARTPELAAAIANKFADIYLEVRRDEKRKTMDRVDAFLMERIAELREQVNKSHQAVQDYRRTHGLYKSGAAGSLTTQQLSELNTQLLAAQTAKADAESRLAEAQFARQGRLDAESVPEVLRSPLIASLKSQLADVERRAADAAATYGARHPQFRSMRAEADALSGRVAGEVARLIDGLARDASTARARHEALAEQFEALKSTMGAVNDKSIQLEALERDATVDRNLLESMLSRAKQSTGSANLLQADAKLVSPAAPADKRTSPPTELAVALATLLAFVAAATTVLVREGGNRTFRQPEQIEAMTGLPVLTMVPRVASRSAARQVLRKPVSPYSESLRRLFVSIMLSDVSALPKRLLFSSAIPGEGKSVMVASLARQLAATGRKVIVVDADWRRPRMQTLLRCRPGPGLGELLGDKGAVLNDCVQRDAMSTVDVITAGKWDDGASHLATSPRMGELLQLLGEAYDVVLIDTPPVLATSDALMLSRMADKVVYVVRWGHTQRDAVLSGLRQFIDARADVAGVALSQVEVKKYRRHSYREVHYSRTPVASFR